MIQLPEQRPFYAIPKGYGLHRLTGPELRERSGSKALFNLLQIWEHPRRGHRYVLGVDVGDGLGRDRSVCDVFRVGTIEEPEEQVAQFITDDLSPHALASCLDTIGQMYRWPDGREAMAAIENNFHGLSVQDTLQLHLGYRHFYIWEVLDQADPKKRFTTKIGWVTTRKSRPILLDQLYSGVTLLDPLSGYPDLRINSPFTIDEMRDFQTDGALWEAEAGRGAHDDCIIAAGIAHYVCWRLLGGETEPLADRRRRRAEESLRRQRMGQPGTTDFRNTDSTADDQQVLAGMSYEERLQVQDEEEEDGFYDPDARGYGGTLY